MKVRWLSGIVAGLILFGIVGMAQASLTQIGYVRFDDGSPNIGAYRLIYDDDLQLIWWDYAKEWMCCSWASSWAQEFKDNGKLEDYQLFSGMFVSWNGDWRLPKIDELGHLHDVEGLGIWQLSPLENLCNDWLWTATLDPENPLNTLAYSISTGFTASSPTDNIYIGASTTVVRPGVVAAVVPLPATILLLASGLAGLGTIRRNRARRL